MVVPGEGKGSSVTSHEYDALWRDIHSVRDDVANDRKAIFDKLDEVAASVKDDLAELRQDLAMRDHQIAETTLRLHRSSMQNQETLKSALVILHQRFEETYTADLAWKEAFKARVLELQGKDADRERAEDALIPGLRPEWTWWQRGLAVAGLLLGTGIASSAVTACAARGGLLDHTPDGSSPSSENRP